MNTLKTERFFLWGVYFLFTWSKATWWIHLATLEELIFQSNPTNLGGLRQNIQFFHRLQQKFSIVRWNQQVGGYIFLKETFLPQIWSLYTVYHRNASTLNVNNALYFMLTLFGKKFNLREHFSPCRLGNAVRKTSSEYPEKEDADMKEK